MDKIKASNKKLTYEELLAENIQLKKEIKKIEQTSHKSVNELKRVQETLIRDQQLLNKTGRLAKIGGWSLDIETMTSYYTNETKNIYGLTLDTDEPKGIEGIQYYPKEAQKKLSKLLQGAIEKGKSYDVELPFINKQGENLWVRTIGIPEKKNGKVTRLYGTIQDISDLKETEKKLKEKEKQYQILFENIVDEVHYWKVIKDKNGNIKTWELVAANSSALKAWNKTKEEVIGKTTNEVFNYDAEKFFRPIVKKIFKSGKPHRWETYFPATKQYLSMDSIPMGDFFLSCGRDISNKKKAEHDLHCAQEKINSSLQQLKIIQANTPNIIWKWEIDKGIDFKNAYISEGVDEFLALPKGSIGNSMRTYFSYILPEYLPKIYELIDYCTENTNKSISIEYEVKKADGKLAWFSSTGRVIKENDKFTIYGSTIDITETKNIEKELLKAKEKAEESEKKLLEAQELSHVGSWEYMMATDVVTWSKELYRIFERSLDLPAPKFTEQQAFYTKDSLAVLIKAVDACVKHEIPYEIALDIYTESGSIKHIISKGNVIKKANKVIGAYGTAQDITVQKKLELELIKAKEKAEENKANITAIIEGTKNSIWAFDTNYTILYINHIFQKDFLQSFGVLLEPGVSLVEALPKTLKPIWKSRYDRVLANEQFVIEDAVATNIGTIYIEISFNPIIKNGKVIGGSCLGSDITIRKNEEKELIQAKEKVEKNEQKLIDAQTVAKVGSWENNLITMDVVWSDETYKIFGLDKEQFKKTHVSFLDYVHPDDIERIEDVFSKSFSSKDYQSVQHRIITPSGELKHVEERWFTFHDSNDKPLVSFGTCQDITENVIIQNQLKSAKEKAEESDRLKSAFLSNMSHEIRTPMNGILGFTSLLQEVNLSTENQKKYINIIEKSGKRLLNTVNDIIEISKIESGEIKITTSKVDVVNYLDTLVTFFKQEAQKKHLQIIVQNDIDGNELYIQTDKNKLDSILSNLIKNAIKYTNQGTIKVGFSIASDNVIFSCQDTGIGISKNRQEAIFNRFEQADIEDKLAKQGSGLGLAIVKSYVEMLHGKIWVESEENQGSTFYVSLPYLQAKQKENNSSKKIPLYHTEIKNINVLIVEDDETSLLYLTSIISDKFNNIEVAKNGIEAIEMCKNNSDINCILMDIRMPGIDGYETTKRIRKFNNDIVIIAQTAYALEGDKEKALNVGCNDYISKPINKDKLFEIINKYF